MIDVTRSSSNNISKTLTSQGRYPSQAVISTNPSQAPRFRLLKDNTRRNNLQRPIKMPEMQNTGLLNLAEDWSVLETCIPTANAAGYRHGFCSPLDHATFTGAPSDIPVYQGTRMADAVIEEAATITQYPIHTSNDDQNRPVPTWSFNLVLSIPSNKIRAIDGNEEEATGQPEEESKARPSRPSPLDKLSAGDYYRIIVLWALLVTLVTLGCGMVAQWGDHHGGLKLVLAVPISLIFFAPIFALAPHCVDWTMRSVTAGVAFAFVWAYVELGARVRGALRYLRARLSTIRLGRD